MADVSPQMTRNWRRCRDGHGGQQAVAGDGPQQSEGVPVSSRRALAYPLPLGRTAIAADHLGAHPALVQKHQILRIDLVYCLAPGLPPPPGFGAVLLGRVKRFFFAATPAGAALLTTASCSIAGPGCAAVARPIPPRSGRAVVATRRAAGLALPRSPGLPDRNATAAPAPAAPSATAVAESSCYSRN